MNVLSIKCTPEEIEELFNKIHKYESPWEIDEDVIRFINNHISEEDQVKWFEYIWGIKREN